MEKLWALSICNIDGFEDALLEILGTTTESAERRSKLMSVWTDDASSESLHDTWKTSRLYGALEKMLSNSEVSPPGTGKRSRNLYESRADERLGSSVLRVTCDSTPLGPKAHRVVGPSSHSSGVKRSRLSHQTLGADVSLSPNGLHATLQLPPNTSQLLDVYFTATHSWFPVIAKHNILRASYLYANAPVSFATATPGSGDHAALWAILSYTINQSRTSLQKGSAGQTHLVREYYAAARDLIPSEKESLELGHVQALLLLTLVNIGLEDWTAAWLLSGQATRMAIAMELGVHSNTQQSEALRQGKAVFLGCFVLDSLLSFRLSRCPAMSPNDLARVGLLQEDGLEEWNSWTDVLPPSQASHKKSPPRRGPLLTLSCFNRLVELASVLNKISRNLSMGYQPSSFAQQLILDLKKWDDGLPLGCRLIGPESIYPERHSALLPHQSYLGLTYVATLLWLDHRLISGEPGPHRSQQPASVGANKLLYRGLSMISQHLENFPTCGVPPIFELALRTIMEQAITLRENADPPDNFPFARWADEFQQKTKPLASTWPVYESLVGAMGRWQQSGTRSETFSSTLIGNATAPTMLTTPMVGSTHSPDGARPLISRDQANYTSSILGISIPVDTQSATPGSAVRDHPDLAMMDLPLQQGLEACANVADQASFPGGSVLPQPSTSDSSTSYPVKLGKVQTKDHSVPTGDTMSCSSDGADDLDAIFKDLAYLDTTEWSNNREAGLRDFGFVDDSTFQAFCHDPDRLVGSQPLVHPPSIADIWPPPGFFPETFQEAPDQAITG